MLRSHVTAIVLVCVCTGLSVAQSTWTNIPKSGWEGTKDVEVPDLKREASAVVAFPANEALPLVASGGTEDRGLYEVQLTLRPSHVANAIAFHSGVRVTHGDSVVAEYPGHWFARPHQPEPRRFTFVHSKRSPLRIQLEAYTDRNVVDMAHAQAGIKKGGPAVGVTTDDLDDPVGGLDDLNLALQVALTPDKSVYYLVDKIEYRRLSGSGYVASVSTDKIRYTPGERLRGQALVRNAAGTAINGSLNLYLEYELQERKKATTVPVALSDGSKTIDFEVDLPTKELGYAIIAEYVSADGADKSQLAEYFSIASNFQRVSLFGGSISTRDQMLSDEVIEQQMESTKRSYFNATEYFAWAEDDMVEMSPDTDFWSSGQTNYRLNKSTLQRQIKIAHKHGIAVSTYGKFIMSGLAGWETAYEYPMDHRDAYNYPVGRWDTVNVGILDRLRDRDYRIYGAAPTVPGNAFHTWWAGPQWVTPDATPRMARIAAEEVIRSIDMFGWDAVRWDGHPRGGGQIGRSGRYIPWAARKTQSLIRYFKDIVAQKYPGFGHGYNYLLIEPNKTHDWAVEDFELDELCRGGGLLMNESIGNASAGWTFASIVRNLQIEGDLCRERGGYYLGISFGSRRPPRDVIIESALWAAAGCRPYNDSMSLQTRRYLTRFSQFSLDENLRRIVTPEALLSTAKQTALQWQPFVYERVISSEKRQLIANILNLPMQDTRPPREGDVKLKFDLPVGSDPVTFKLSLPAGMTATGVRCIDPQTLEVARLPLQSKQFTLPPVLAWRVVVVDIETTPDVPALVRRFGPPITFNTKRADLADDQRVDEITLDPSQTVEQATKRIAHLQPSWVLDKTKRRQEVDQMSTEERNRHLIDSRPTVEQLASSWWKGAAIPADNQLKGQTLDLPTMTPRRNGRMDIFHARGPLDYNLRIPAAWAKLDRFQVHDAWLWGAVQRNPNMGLARRVPIDQYPDFDLMLFTGIPHAAIGVKNCYALTEYVRAGGSVLFTGGEYAFGKGGYMHTVIERDLFPFHCTAMVDTVYHDPAGAFELGPDFAELNAELDFSARPAFWVRNEVVLKPGAKVFLAAGDRPILVGYEVGKGRVACLLVDHRGTSENGVTAFFDWSDWPNLLHAVMTWLVPDVGNEQAIARNDENAKALLAKLEDLGFDDDLGDLDLALDSDDGLSLGNDSSDTKKAVELKGPDLEQRLKLINQGLDIGGDRVASALAAQLATVENLPLDTRLRIFELIKRASPSDLSSSAKDAMSIDHTYVRASGYVLQAATGSSSFRKTIQSPRGVTIETPDMRDQRLHDLAIAVVFYPKSDLVTEGRRRVAAWNKQESDTATKYLSRINGDADMLQTSPLLNADSIFARIAWLAYLSRHDAATYGGQFLKQWFMIDQYRDYCGRTHQYTIAQESLSKAAAAACTQRWNSLSRRLATLKRLTRDDAAAIIAKSTDQAAVALSSVRFSAEARAAINLLGSLSAKDTNQAISASATTRHPDMDLFIRTRRR